MQRFRCDAALAICTINQDENLTVGHCRKLPPGSGQINYAAVKFYYCS